MLTKDLVKEILSNEEFHFNKKLSKPRVSSEHTIGILKGWFPWLRNIRVKITEDDKSLDEILDYIKVCIILHIMPIPQFEEDEKDFMFEDDILLIKPTC